MENLSYLELKKLSQDLRRLSETLDVAAEELAILRHIGAIVCRLKNILEVVPEHSSSLERLNSLVNEWGNI